MILSALFQKKKQQYRQNQGYSVALTTGDTRGYKGFALLGLSPKIKPKIYASTPYCQ
tara:strand:- start:1351 stop:1521 length:171 start_codon:yes stop_codon:yes gene_type:complete